MPMEFDIVKVGKMLDRAGHPGTPDPERVLSVAKAYSYCSANGKTFADVAACMDAEVFIQVNALSHRDLRAQIADLSIARDDDAMQIAELKNHVAALMASKDRQREERDVLQAQLDQLGAELAEVRKENDKLRHRADGEPITEQQAVNDDRLIEQPINASVEVVDPEVEPVIELEEWTASEWLKFKSLASAGYTKAMIARTLTTMLDRIVSISCVSRLMRIRWSPKSGRRFALWEARPSPA